MFADAPSSIDFELSDRDVHVWSAALTQPPVVVELLASRLSSDEQVRAAAFRRDQDRLRFIVGRGVLRTLLGSYLQTPPERLMFRYQRFGKPVVRDPARGGWLRFNLAHSCDLALFAVARERNVGVDLERLGSVDKPEELAQYVCSPRELETLAKLPANDLPAAFLRCWTRKEAYLKGTGAGLSLLPPNSIDVTFGSDEPAKLLGVHGRPSETTRWSMLELSPSAGYIGALAVRGGGRLTCRQLDVPNFIFDRLASKSRAATTHPQPLLSHVETQSS